MKIVITDGYTLNPGDLDWTPLSRFGILEIFDRSSKEETLARCRDADIIVTNKTPISSEVIESNSHLKLIAVTATGYNIVDIIAARKAGVFVSNVPEYGTDSVAQHTFALILALANQTGSHGESVRSGGWAKAPDWSYSVGPIVELRGKTLGIVGFGRIGHRVAELGRAFGLNVLFFDPSCSEEGKVNQLETLVAASDIVSLHCPLTSENREFVNANLMRRMRPGAFLINTSRGQLINERDLAEGLRNGRPAWAALDVLANEPPAPDNPLTKVPNCLITPHIAWLALEARQRILQTTIGNIDSVLRGQPTNVVNR